MTVPEPTISAVELIRALSHAVRAGTPTMGVTVGHPPHRDGSLGDRLKGMTTDGSAENRGPTGLFAAGALEAGMVAMTTASAPDEADLVQLPTGGEAACVGFPRNVSFLYDGSRQTDVLLVAPASFAGPTGNWPRLLRDMCLAVATAAVAVNAPILLMYAPAAPPGRRSGGSTTFDHDSSLPLEWRDPYGPCLRFSVALGPSYAATEWEFRRALICAAVDLGCGLYFRRTEVDRDGRGWENVVAAEPSENYAAVSHEQGLHLRLTAVGPARIGSTKDLLGLVEALGLSVSSIALTALQGMAIIHIVLWMPLRVGEPAHQDDAGPASSGLVLEQSLELLLKRLHGRYGHGDLPGLLGGRFARIQDYQFVMSDDPPAQSRDTEEPYKPLWLAWRTPRTREAMTSAVSTMIRSVRQGFPKEIPADIDFLVCRESQEDWLRGRCKVRVPIWALGDVVSQSRSEKARTGTKRKIGLLCSRIEHDWRDALRAELHTPWVEAEVAWRERWIGRMETFIAIR
jgi:hypothetical protein